MASARELLEQADALMQRNRTRAGSDIPVLTEAVVDPANVALAANADDVPVLTDAVESDAQLFAAGGVDALLEDSAPVEAPASARASPFAVMPDPPPAVEAPSQDALAPVLAGLPAEEPDEGDPSDWLVMDTIDPALHSITGAAPDTLAVVPPMTLRTEGASRQPFPLESAPPASPLNAPPSAMAAWEAPEPQATTPKMEPLFSLTLDHDEVDATAVTEMGEPPEQRQPPLPSTTVDEERWRALAEQVSMQVLQRIDLFTDTGLKQQLAERLRPSVERASAELVDSVTEHIGKLLRTYVAEAIEKEIAQWRLDH